MKKLPLQMGMCVTATFRFLAVALGLTVLLTAYMAAPVGQIYLTPWLEDARGWTFYTVNGRTTVELEPSEAAALNGVYYLERKMDESVWPYETAPTLELSPSPWQFTVFVEGAPLYTTSPEAGDEIGRLQFPAASELSLERRQCTLPENWRGKTLTIGVLAPKGNSSMPMVRVSDQIVRAGLNMTEANWSSIPATVFAVLGLLLVGLFLNGWTQNRPDRPLLLLAAVALSQTAFYLSRFQQVGIGLLSWNAEINNWIAACVPLLYVLCRMKRHRRWAAPLVLIPSAVYLALAVIWYFSPTPDALYFLPCLLYLSLSACVVGSILEYRDENAFFRFFVPVLGISGAGLGILWVGDILLHGYQATFGTYVLECLGNGSYVTPQYWAGILLLAVSFLCALLCFIQETADEKVRLQMIAARSELTEETLRVVQESGRSLAEFRHNFLHHLTAMEALGKSGEYARLQKYLNSLIQETEAPVALKLTAHPAVNAVLTVMLDRAKRQGVKTEVFVSLPATLSIPDNDLCGFLMNLLDNGLEAAAAVPDEEKRRLSLSMQIKGEYLCINSENTCAAPAELDPHTGLGISRKPGPHGHGMKTMDGIAHRYQSELRVTARPESFRVSTTLLLPP